MSISIIRRVTADDATAVHAAAAGFCNRHGIDPGDDAESAIEYAIYCGDKRLRKLWTACYCRALDVPVNVRTTIGLGYIGLNCD